MNQQQHAQIDHLIKSNGRCYGGVYRNCDDGCPIYPLLVTNDCDCNSGPTGSAYKAAMKLKTMHDKIKSWKNIK